MDISDPEIAALRLLIVLIGPAAGSFAALLADRLVRGEPVILVRSHCRACGVTLRVRDMVPLFSALWLRGRCAACGKRFPVLLSQAEVVGLVLGLAVAILVPDPLVMVLGALLLWCLLAIALSDLQHFRLPWALLIALLALAFAIAVLEPDGILAERLIWSGAGAAVGTGTFWLLRLLYSWRTGREGLGMGDVALMAGIGAAVGPLAIPWVTLLAGVAALTLSVLRAHRHGRRLRRTGRVPFGAALAIGAAVMWLAGWL